MAAMRYTPTSSPSPGTPGEGWGEGLQNNRSHSRPDACAANPHPTLCRSTGRGKWGLVRRVVVLTIAGFSIGYLSFAGGCASSATTQPSSVTERQNQALHDPFGYTPDVKSSDLTVSGHGEGFDKKGFDRDTNSVLNP